MPLVTARVSKTLVLLGGVCTTLALSWCRLDALFPRDLSLTEMPVNRLITNLERQKKISPMDYSLVYSLARVHSIAYASNKNTISATKQKKNEVGSEQWTLAPTFLQYPKRKNKIDSSAIKHLDSAVKLYTTATQLVVPKNNDKAEAWLGLAWLLEEAMPYTDSLSYPNQMVQNYGVEQWRQGALGAYRKVYKIRSNKDLKQRGFLETPLSLEASQGIIRLQKGYSLNSYDQQELKTLQWHIKQVNQKPRYVTPIIFPISQQTSYFDLTNSQHTVSFDLLGDKIKRKWSWVSKRAGILVWDPLHTGKIQFAWQLFGTRTWYVFWKNGFQPLKALDNNSDGWLTGRELDGLSVWIDYNENGVSDKGEVKPISQFHIRRIAVGSLLNANNILWNPHGIQMDTGDFLPMYDWISQTR